MFTAGSSKKAPRNGKCREKGGKKVGKCKTNTAWKYGGGFELITTDSTVEPALKWESVKLKSPLNGTILL